jgi:NAD(P)-dependent dehydrogenase (short-subunit alcohol dehydrogenase family)
MKPALFRFPSLNSASNQLAPKVIMVNNTGLTSPHPAETLSFETFKQEVSTTIDSVFFGCQAAARVMMGQEPLAGQPYAIRGTIINVASVAGEMAIAGHASFCAAMAGVIAMTKVLAAEWGPYGLRVAAVGVGLTEALLEKTGEVEVANLASSLPAKTYMTLKSNAPPGYVPLRAPATPAAVGQAVAYLAGSAAGYITGTSLPIDGGWLAYGYL